MRFSSIIIFIVQLLIKILNSMIIENMANHSFVFTTANFKCIPNSITRGDGVTQDFGFDFPLKGNFTYTWKLVVSRTTLKPLSFYLTARYCLDTNAVRTKILHN